MDHLKKVGRDAKVEAKVQGGVSVCGDYIFYSHTPYIDVLFLFTKMSVGASRGH